MNLNNKLKEQFGSLVSLHEINENKFQLYAPFYHEDGDMFTVYLDIDNSNGNILIRDYGNALMRVSYTFDIDTPNKKNILENIVQSNDGELDEGEIQLKSKIDNLPEAILQYSQIISKVSNIDILRRENVRSMFYENLKSSIQGNLSNYSVSNDLYPTNDKDLVVDYAIQANKPIYIFGVNDNAKASKVVISCLNFINRKIPFKSFVVHEDFNGLTNFNRNQITNAADKQFTSLDDFNENCITFIEREIAS